MPAGAAQIFEMEAIATAAARARCTAHFITFTITFFIDVSF
jgi:hypothetical protein